MGKFRKIICMAVALTSLLAVYGCGADEKTVGRFTVIDRFYIFNGDSYKKGKVIKDRKTGECYLYLWDGAGNGGVAMEKIDC